MSVSDLEIEYLDEDEDLVQQCIETLQEAPQPSVFTINPPKIFGGHPRHLSPKAFLTERICLQKDSDDEKPQKQTRRIRNRTLNKVDSDADYDPSQDNSEDEPILDEFERPRRPQRFLKLHKSAGAQSNRLAPKVNNKTLHNKGAPVKSEPGGTKDTGPMALKHSKFISKYQEIFTNSLKIKKEKISEISKTSLEISRNDTETIVTVKPKISASLDANKAMSAYSKVADAEPFKIFPPQAEEIRLYDYGDSKYITGAKVLSDDKSIEKWNNMCRLKLKHYKEEKNVKSSKTTQYIRKVDMKRNGKLDTVLKLHVETRSKNEVDIFQAFLPKFELDKPKIKVNFRQPVPISAERNNTRKLKTDTLLTTETTKDGQVLVAYSITDSRSTTFKMVEAGKDGKNGDGRHIRMLMSCSMCANCYQYSWRGTTHKKGVKEAQCATCGGTFTSAYNLLAHLRAHDAADVRLRRKQQIELLSKIVGYHYKCRICRYVAKSIKGLRSHLRMHKGVRKFKCEVGQHVTS